MKKSHLLIVLLGLSISLIAQQKTTQISELIVDGLRLENYTKANKKSQEVEYFARIEFKDITFKGGQQGFINFKNKKHINLFTKDLKEAQQELILNEDKGKTKWGHRHYFFYVQDIDNTRIYITPSVSERSGLTYINKDKVDDIIAFLEAAQME